jgi:diphthamide synthase subunit DPH2
MPELYRVFVSHAARDRCIAERIAEALRARGARPFLDVYDIEKGDNTPKTIRRELNRTGRFGCSVYIVVSTSLGLG